MAALAGSTIEQLAAGMAREDGGKRRQVIEGARKVFLSDGFDGASMSEISRVAGVSKGTLYVYFASKEELFAALIREEKQGQAERLCEFLPLESDFRATLIQFGVRFMELMMRPASIAHMRTVVAVAGKFPAIGQAYYESGPEFGQRRLARYLDAQVASGHIAIGDTATAAIQLVELCKGHHLLKAIFCVGETPSRDEIEAHVAHAVETFIRAYAVADEG